MNLFKRISASVVLTAPLLFSSNVFAGANTQAAKAVTSAPSVDFSGQIGLTFFHIDGDSLFGFDGPHHPEFNVTGRTKFFGMDTVAFFGVTTPTTLHTEDSTVANAVIGEFFDIDSLNSIEVNRVGMHFKGNIGDIGVGYFETSSARTLKNNFSPVDYTAGGLASTVQGYVLTSGSDMFRPLGSSLTSWKGQGKAFHVGYTTPMWNGFTASVDYVPFGVNRLNGAAVSVEKSSLSGSFGYVADVKGVKADVRGSYSNRLRTWEFFSSAFKYKFMNLSAAFDFGGPTASVAVARKSFDGSSAPSASPTAYDVTLGHYMPMSGGKFGVLGSFTRVDKALEGGLLTVVNNIGGVDYGYVSSNKSDIYGLGVSYDQGNMHSTARWSNMTNKVSEATTSGGTAVAHSYKVNMFSVGTSYSF